MSVKIPLGSKDFKLELGQYSLYLSFNEERNGYLSLTV